jgi:hypothetical protein
MACNCSHVDILFEINEHGGPGIYVGVENAGGCDPGLGKWVQRPDGFWALRIKEDEWPTHSSSSETSNSSSLSSEGETSVTK